MKRIFLTTLACLGVNAALAETYPMTVTDGRGVEVVIETAPKRVAALWTGAADLMVALGQPVAGVTTYEGEMPVYLGGAMDGAIDLGDLTAPNLELMAVSDFDLTIGMTRYNAPYAEDIGKFSPFISYEGFDTDGAIQAIADLGAALGEAEKVAGLNADFLTQIDELAAKAPDDPRSALVIWSFQDTLFGYKDNLMAADLVSRLGVVNPLGRQEGDVDPNNAFVILEAEDLLKIDPDVILMFVSHGGAVPFQPAYERLKAYQSNKIYSVGYQYSQPSGPIARDLVVREAAHLIYPEVFEAPQMPDAARAVPLKFAR